MSNIINPDLISQAAKQAEMTSPEVKPTAPANESDTQKFDSAMNQPQQNQAAQSVQAATAPSAATSPSAVASTNPGDTVLDQLHKISDEMAKDNKFVKHALDHQGENLSPVDALKLQYHLAQMTTDMTLVTSVASDLKKGVTTLMTNQ